MSNVKMIHTDNAPAAVGPYSQAVTANGFIFTAGQLGLVPETMKLVEGGVAEQARQALTNLKAILESAGSNLQDVVKTSVFLQDLNDFAAMNVVYAEFFGEHRPARSTFQAAKLPLGGIVEIEAVAVVR